MDYSQKRVTIPDPNTSKHDVNKTPSVDAPLSVVKQRRDEYIAALEACELARVNWENAARAYYKARQDAQEVVEGWIMEVSELREKIGL